MAIEVSYNLNSACIDISGLNPYTTYSYNRSATDGESFYLPNLISGKSTFSDFFTNIGVTYLVSILVSGSVIFQKVVNSGNYDGSFLINSGVNKNQQISITFDENITSFKPVRKDVLIETIGSKFPFVIRNASVNYKSMEFSGMITSEMDPKNFSGFGSGSSSSNYEQLFLNERRFRDWFESWINDGLPKIFKSATEGMKIVRIHNVSFTPIRQLGRVLYNFSCTITEIADYTISNLVRYKFVNSNLTAATNYGLLPLNDLYPSEGLYPFSSISNF